MAAGHRAAARSVLDGGEHGATLGQIGGNRGDTIMQDTSLLQLALGIVPPWTVTGSEFDAAARRLDIHIDFTAGSRFACPGCGTADCQVHDAHSGDLERSFRSIMNTDSGDHDHPHEPARAGAGERCAVMLVRHH
jgi:hypothetical protein